MLNLCKLQPQVLTALRLTLLDRVFSIFPSVEDALSEADLQIP
jgi:anti-anti-sigma regulatory factor